MWIESFDGIDLIKLLSTVTELGIADQFDRMLYAKLSANLGPPVQAPKANSTKKSPARVRKGARAPDQGSVATHRPVGDGAF
jgi:hypothetical protein